ncbi:hypothetical protein DAERI_010479 [Deinococcus aerius]|uniref:Uncharacterized protein n=1 Tax=Deinococcus aerius TaxID=200253 RepID=A0A2I9DQ58_9DEIO|nr:hypothetical protein DAERI_010479 [Deinococcus aerius]
MAPVTMQREAIARKAGKHVEVRVKDPLPSRLPVGEKEVDALTTDRPPLEGGEVREAGRMPARHDQDVSGRDQVDVEEGGHEVVLVPPAHLCLAPDDAAKHALLLPRRHRTTRPPDGGR